MSLPRYQNVRKVDGLGILLADLLKQLNDLRNREPELYPFIVEVLQPYIVPEYVPVFIDVIQPIMVEVVKEIPQEYLPPTTGGSGLEFVTVTPLEV